MNINLNIPIPLTSDHLRQVSIGRQVGSRKSSKEYYTSVIERRYTASLRLKDLGTTRMKGGDLFDDRYELSCDRDIYYILIHDVPIR